MDKSKYNSISSGQDQINRIKHMTYCSKEVMIQSTIDALGAYGKPAINAINELINCSSIDKKVKTHALSVIQSIKSSS
jgi:hypothetical protein